MSVYSELDYNGARSVVQDNFSGTVTLGDRSVFVCRTCSAIVFGSWLGRSSLADALVHVAFHEEGTELA